MKVEDCPIFEKCPKVNRPLCNCIGGDIYPDTKINLIYATCAACDGPHPVEPRTRVIYDESGFTSGVGISDTGDQDAALVQDR